MARWQHILHQLGRRNFRARRTIGSSTKQTCTEGRDSVHEGLPILPETKQRHGGVLRELRGTAGRRRAAGRTITYVQMNIGSAELDRLVIGGTASLGQTERRPATTRRC